ncbi:IucA/IucC family protein [Metabacillus bambusae]|uniref:IucA/IucC family siderophore biosynthesis protein n=1 Tax=Metabacillus bambusae TaxID=2795218 RepID=A0ABS3N375_9BACI|nr:IucA/IucC family siderophore biosynthesis protein [Metabacillus bambusae]MBO1512514.1 IucA/IucC family siderophore biosynthesis protein [Metabacillus bambusae]
MNIPFISNHLTMQNLLNCYIKETRQGVLKDAKEIDFQLEDDSCNEVYDISLKSQSVTLYVPVRYKSITGRHLLSPSMYYQVKNGEVKALDYLTLITYLQKEFAETSNKPVHTEELILRTILSYQTIKGILLHRSNDLDECYQTNKTFLQSEQSLLIGHQVHPTPKSRQGIDEDEEHIFAPERKGSFQLHYFHANNDFVEEDSILAKSATALIKEEIKKDSSVSEEFKETYCHDDGYSLIPVHPLQARKLLGKENVCQLIQSGKLSYLGPQGRKFSPTSSVRTVYSQDTRFMYKFSIPVKITNSLRINKRKELDRGVEVSRLLECLLNDKLNVQQGFKIIQDPAYITLKLDEEESGFEVVIRENPFQQGEAERTTLLAGLCQDHIAGGSSHLANIINNLAKIEKLSIRQVSEEWFRRYLKVSLQPLYWMYATYGIALEAHQQNSIIKLDEKGYPQTFYYRDNQGYYFMESKAEILKQIIPNLNEKSDTICADTVAEERFRYYFFFNHLFGLINSFGVNRLIDEQQLLLVLKDELRLLQEQYGDSTNLLNSLLTEETLPCKANLLTRVHDMDELVGSLETQSVYTHVANPLYKLVGELHGV